MIIIDCISVVIFSYFHVKLPADVTSGFFTTFSTWPLLLEPRTGLESTAVTLDASAA